MTGGWVRSRAGRPKSRFTQWSIEPRTGGAPDGSRRGFRRFVPDIESCTHSPVTAGRHVTPDSSAPELDPRLSEAIKKVTGKRPRTVIDHIVAHGHITTEELESTYGYAHPPRAARDVREAGIPLETFKVRGSQGRTIAAYRFGDPSKIEAHKLGGRRTFPKSLKDSLVERPGARCEICLASYDARHLQVDHAVPYEVVGDVDELEMNVDDFLLLCASCQRAKSWTCESCVNLTRDRDPAVCANCQLCSPSNYAHMATEEIRRLELVWQGDEVAEFGTVGRQNLMRPTDTHDASLLAPACCRLAGSASAAPACVPPESRAPMTDAAASRCSAGRTHQAPASDAVR